MVNYKRIYELDAHSSIVSTDVIPISATWSWNAEKQTISGLTTYIVANLTAIPATSISDGSISNTEFWYLNGVSSNIQTQLDGKASTSHNHDDRYYTETEMDVALSWKANTTHTHTTTEITNLASYTWLDSRYYTETEVDTALSGKANSSHTHSASDIVSWTIDWDRLPWLSSTKKGWVPATWTPSGKYLKDDGTWDTPSWGGWWSSTWWSITGTLSSQTDLQTALDSKVDENVAITWGTKTKITYDAKWLVTSWADATTADIADSTNKRYVTDAQLIVIGNTSGTNTGDQTSIVWITGTKAQFDTAVTDWNFLYVGDVTQYTDEQAQDAVGAMVDTTIVYNDVTPSLSRAALAGAITASAGSNTTSLWSFTTSQLNTALSDNDVATQAGTETLTNKRNQPRVVSATSYTTDTGTSLDVATCDIFIVTAQAGALLFNNPSWTPVQWEKLIIRIKDNGTARALTYGSQFRASSDLALPTTTVVNKTLYMWFIYNSTDTKRDLIAVLNNL